MKRRVVLSRRAQKDTDEIAGWIARDNVAAGNHWLEGLDSAIETISITVGIGTNRSDLRPAL